MTVTVTVIVTVAVTVTVTVTVTVIMTLTVTVFCNILQFSYNDKTLSHLKLLQFFILKSKHQKMSIG